MRWLLSTLCTRIMMIAFWISVIFAFLFLPSVTRFGYEQKSLNLFIFPVILDPHVLAQFEQETGVKVYINYYETNEELYSKLKATQGEGYDIIVPTDYTVEVLISDGLLKKIDKTKLPMLQQIRPDLMGNYFDPNNEYSIPYYMSVFGLGINKEYFKGVLPDPTWALVFDRNLVKTDICMLDSIRESIFLASLYIYGNSNFDDPKTQLIAIEELLRTQKQWVDVYTSNRIEELLASGSCPVAIGTSPDVWKAAHEYPNIEFVMPQEGSFLTIDSFVIPKSTTKDVLIYQLLNYLYRPEVLAVSSLSYGFCSPLQDVEQVSPSIFCPTNEQFKKLHFFENVLTKTQMQDVLLAVKAY